MEAASFDFDNAAADGFRDRLCPAAAMELGQQIAGVDPDRALADGEFGADLLIGLALCDRVKISISRGLKAVSGTRPAS